MIQSVISRLAFFSALALLILAVPIFYYINAEASPLNTSAKGEASLGAETSAISIVEAEAAEEPVIQLASLTVGLTKPTLKILEPLGSLKSDTGARVEMASELAKDQKFDEGLTVLDGVHFADRDNYSVKFLEARILSWAGKNKQAEQAFVSLRAQYPQDLDIMLSSGYLQYYQRNYSDSERIFAEVLDLNPDYGDARTGLEKSRLAQNKR